MSNCKKINFSVVTSRRDLPPPKTEVAQEARCVGIRKNFNEILKRAGGKRSPDEEGIKNYNKLRKEKKKGKR